MPFPRPELRNEPEAARPEIVVHRDPLDCVTVAQVSGDLNLAATKFLGSAIADAAKRPGEHLLIDLSDCPRLDGDGLMMLLCARRAMDGDRACGPPLAVVVSPGPAARALDEAGLSRLVPIVADRHAAHDILLGSPAGPGRSR